MRRFFKYFFFALLILVISGIGFSFLEPMNPAKIFLKVAGIHDQNKKELDGFKNLLLDNSYTKYSKLDEIPDDYQQKLRRIYLSGRSDNPDTLDLNTIYAREGDEWNPTDVIIDENTPVMQFRYAYCSDQSLILIAKCGGFGVTIAYEAFTIENYTLVRKYSISHYDDNFFSLALALRFQDDYSNFVDEPDLLLPEE